ncbi:MAG: cbb3-type cytochrome c oxidase subunit I, partial [Abditibacteriales bacterium]|nr:cbb3-type cytochrome c oxidase subunit I [Abditibacteriales bacterium]
LQLAFPEREWGWLGKLMPKAMEKGIMKPEFYIALVTMHGTIMVFFVLTAGLTGGFGNFLIPLKIGARDMAFPFLNMLSYWVFLVSCVVMMLSFVVEGGPAAAGWTAYPPLSALKEAVPGSGLGQTLWLLSLAIFIASSLFGSLNYITTILNMRTRGMTMGRLPLTVWALFITAILGLLSFPVLFAAAIMLLFDRHLGTSFFVPSGLFLAGKTLDHQGGNPILWQHLFWFLGHPEVYIVILPPMGMASDILSTHARKPIFGYKAMVASILAIAFLSFIVWGHHMFVSGMNPYLGGVFMMTTLLIAVPSAIKTFNWLTTLWRSNIHFTTPMLFAIGFVSIFVSGGLTGVFLGNPPVDIQLHDTYFVVAHFHLVMGSAALFGLFAAIYHWFPKMFGRMMSEVAGKWHFWLTFIGVYGVFFPMHYLGFRGVTRRYYDYQDLEVFAGIMPMQHVITFAALLTGAAQVIFFVNFLWSMVKGRRAEKNPWRANTLEWQADSPPPHGNWGPELPTVYRWPYDYSLPDAPEDFVPQTVSDLDLKTPADGNDKKRDEKEP